MAVAKFIQISDLHLGIPCGWLPAAQREEQRREQQRALEAAVALAIERGALAILIPGDLFDRDGVDAESLAFAVHAFAVAGCPPVFIAPGNHDPWSETSPIWNSRLLKARGWEWPEHVHVFTTTGFSRIRLPGRPIEIWGRCFSSSMPSAERPLEPRGFEAMAAPRAGAISVGLFHGSREGFSPPGQKLAAPFSDAEAERAPFTYMAVGHYHTRSRLDTGASEGGSHGVRLAYSGSTVAINPNELGAHGALEVDITYGSGRPSVAIEFVPLDSRQVHDLAVDVSGAAGVEEIERRIRAALDDAGVGERDLVTVRLQGRLVRGVRYRGLSLELKARAFHVRIDARGLRSDYDLEAYRRDSSPTTENRFVRALLDQAEAEPDPDQRAVIEDALYYGLDAFRLREVVPAHEEPSA